MDTESGLSFVSPELIENPYPFHAMLRDQMPVFYLDRQDIWLVSRYEDCVAVLRNPAVFRQWDGSELVEANPEMLAMRQEAWGDRFGTVATLATSDPPEHTRYRSITNQAWSAKRTAEDMEPRIRQIANDLVDAFVSEGRVELAGQFAYPFPAYVIGEILGMPPEDWEKLTRWSDDIVAILGGNLSKERMQECLASGVDFHRYFAAVVEDRRHNPRDDVLTVLMNARPDGHAPLETREMLGILQQMLVAGHETTRNLIASAMWLILSHEGILERLVAEPSLIPNAIEEALRVESPVQGLFRRTAEDAEVGGSLIPAGSKLLVLFASANRDDRQFPEADRFDPFRQNARRNIALGFGVHMCIGAPLGRKEGQIALETLLARLPNLRLAGGQEFRHHPHPLLRGLEKLWLEFDPPAAGTASASGPRARAATGAGRGGLEIRIDRDACGGTGDCVRLLPAVFALDTEGKSTVADTAGAAEEEIVRAAVNCPTSAISVLKDGETIVK